MNVKNLILEKAECHPQRPAIIFEDREISFSQLKNDSFRLANYLINIDMAVIVHPSTLI